MRLRWHSLALLTLTALLQGCYLDHALGERLPTDPPIDPPIAPPPGACGCAEEEVCIRACWGEEMCVPRPTGRTLADGCNTDDPCEDVGVCFGRETDGVFDCACVATPEPVDPPPAEPVVVCGTEVCGPGEACVEHCDALVPSCQPVEASCNDTCGCFDEDPCGALGRENSVCTGVSAEQHVICSCELPTPTCEESIDGTAPAACDPESFGSCWRRIEGVECCRASAYCDGGLVQREITCDDSCGQACEFVANEGDCAVYGCEWFNSDGACIDPAENIRVGTGCIPPRGGACDPSELSPCAAGEVCMGFAFHPCLDEPCDACGAIDWRCSQPLLSL